MRNCCDWNGRNRKCRAVKSKRLLLACCRIWFNLHSRLLLKFEAAQYAYAVAFCMLPVVFRNLLFSSIADTKAIVCLGSAIVNSLGLVGTLSFRRDTISPRSRAETHLQDAEHASARRHHQAQDRLDAIDVFASRGADQYTTQTRKAMRDGVWRTAVIRRSPRHPTCITQHRHHPPALFNKSLLRRRTESPAPEVVVYFRLPPNQKPSHGRHRKYIARPWLKAYLPSIRVAIAVAIDPTICMHFPQILISRCCLDIIVPSSSQRQAH